MPSRVEYYVSDDNINFTLAQTVNNYIKPQDYNIMVASFDAVLENTTARYIKVKAYNYGKLPEWHQGAGSEAFIFIDEIIITP